MVVIR